MSDLLYIPLNEKEQLVVATDCSGAIGESELDEVQADYAVVSYYLARVALMELMCEDVKVVGYSLSNMIKDGWGKIHSGLNQAFTELGMDNLPFIGSTETNFNMRQSAMGITIMGKTKQKPSYKKYSGYGVLGEPLVGQEVVENSGKIIELGQIKALRELKGIGKMVPVGSKGVAWEFEDGFGMPLVNCDLDTKKSSGPSTCVIINYDMAIECYLKETYSEIFHKIEVK